MIQRDTIPADQQLHTAVYDALFEGVTAPIYDRIPDGGKALEDSVTKMPYVVISSLQDTDRSTLTTRGHRYEAHIIVYSDASSRQEAYTLKQQVIEALDRNLFSLSDHYTVKARYLRGPVRIEAEPKMGRSFVRADIFFEYFTQVKPN